MEVKNFSPGAARLYALFELPFINGFIQPCTLCAPSLQYS